MESERPMKSDKFLFLICILLSIATLSSVGCKPQISEPLPPALLGEWRTDDPKFTGFSFVIEKDFLLFKDQNAEKKIERNKILKIEKTELAPKTLYTLHCKNEEGIDIVFALYFQNGRDGSIRLKNQNRFIWKKMP